MATDTSAPFPVRWDQADDAQMFWFRDVMHNPTPVSPLNATMFQPAFAEGASRAIAKLSMPIAGLRTSVQNGYVYLGLIPVMGTPEELAARFGEMQRLTMELGPTVLQDWRETFEPQIHASMRQILGFDYESRTAAEIARAVPSLYQAVVDAYDVHMRVNIPPMNAVFGLEEMLGQMLGPEAVSQSRLLLQGFDNKSIETARAIWAISRWVRSVPGLAEVVLAARVRGDTIELGEHLEAAGFHQRLVESLAERGLPLQAASPEAVESAAG